MPVDFEWRDFYIFNTLVASFRRPTSDIFTAMRGSVLQFLFLKNLCHPHLGVSLKLRRNSSFAWKSAVLLDVSMAIEGGELSRGAFSNLFPVLGSRRAWMTSILHRISKRAGRPFNPRVESLIWPWSNLALSTFLALRAQATAPQIEIRRIRYDLAARLPILY